LLIWSPIFIISDIDVYIDLTDVQPEEVVVTDILRYPTTVEVAQVGHHPYVSALMTSLEVAAVLARAPELGRSAFRCLLATKALGTVRACSSVLDRFERFCFKHNLPFPVFTPDCLFQYVLFLDSGNAPHSAFKIHIVSARQVHQPCRLYLHICNFFYMFISCSSAVPIVAARHVYQSWCCCPFVSSLHVLQPWCCCACSFC